MSSNTVTPASTSTAAALRGFGLVATGAVLAATAWAASASETGVMFDERLWREEVVARNDEGADEGWYSGLGVRYRGSHGLDPRGLRASTDIRLEGATGDSTFGKGSAELTVQRPLGSLADVGLTFSGGSSLGGLPLQRRWFLGGTQTVRALDPSRQWSGNSYWFARAELGRPIRALRLSVFGDFGSVSETRNPFDGLEPAKSVGLGFTFFDGVMRFDVARGLYPEKHTRVSFYLGSRF